ncbi:proteinase-activated receptor 4-like isoform X1 [Engystomops pustulosus]|uniref:proteinase-activated receptor 4-like isoform X1 n=1 Tax=Engystomops pustulosus TaxID=76066 RepID=UPI003AFB181F
MSARVICTIVVLLYLMSVLKASCPGVVPPRGRQIRTDCNSSRLNKDAQKHLESIITTRVVPALYSVVFFLGLPTNGVALWVLSKAKKMPSTILLINLAIADLMFMLALPFKITYYFMENNWIFGEPLCRIVTAVFYGNMYCSVLFLTGISIDRYIGLVHPFCSKSLRDWRLYTGASIGIWIMGVAAVSGFTMVPQTKCFIDPHRVTCHDIWAHCQGYDWYTLYFLGLFIMVFAVPLLIILFCYLRIFVTLAKKRESYRRVIGLLSLVLLTFILCFTPSNILLVLHYLETSWERHNQLYIWYMLALCLTSLNSCIDPFIYYYVSSDFWTLVKETLCIHRAGNSTSSQSTKKTKLTSSSEREMLTSGV